MTKLLTLQEIAERSGFTLSTLYSYKWSGLLPPPVMKAGNSPLYAARDVATFMREHVGCPARRKSVRLAKKQRRGRRA